MSGSTYSRTRGRRILASTYTALRARHPDLPFASVDALLAALGSDDRAEEWSRHVEALPFLQFARVAPDEDDPRSFGAVDHDAPGAMLHSAASQPFSLGMPLDVALSALMGQGRLSADDWRRALDTFSGQVELRELPAGVTLYRIVGLLSAPSDLTHGYDVNRPLGAYWMFQHPSDFASRAAWRAAMAVRCDWNGNFGYVAITLKTPFWAAVGAARMQAASNSAPLVHPGGGTQVFLPGLSNAHLQNPMDGEALATIIHPTGWSE